MVSTYHGIETGRRAVEYFKKGMETAGINISNTDKEGYSRLAVSKQASDALSTIPKYSRLGTGVEITSIDRMRSMFLDAQMRRTTTEQAYWKTMANGVLRVEKFIVSVNQKGFNAVLDSFWTGLEEVHKAPSDSAVRNAFLLEADTLAKFTSDLSSVYDGYRAELNGNVRDLVTDANSYIDQIAVLNKAILDVRVAGGEPNSLLDRRDLLADKLVALTGAEVGTSRDETDGDYKIAINGKLVVQGTNTRHLILVENPANKGYFDVQIEYNQYDITSNPDAAQVIIETYADDLRVTEGSCSINGTHELDVIRTADEMYWTVGHALGQSAGGERIDNVLSPNDSLAPLSGSFALQVGSRGVRAYSQVYEANPPGFGKILGAPGPGDREFYTFRIAAGDFESTISLTWNATQWEISDNRGVTPASIGTAGNVSVNDLGTFINNNYGAYVRAPGEFWDSGTLVLEGQNGHVLSISDMTGELMRSSGLANENPIVVINVEAGDSLQTIANKINNAYMFDRAEIIEVADNDGIPNNYVPYTTYPPNTPPSSPEQWVHASVERSPDGGYFLCVTSNVAGEANRINVLSGKVCGGNVNEMNMARVLGLVEDIPGSSPQTNAVSYIQLDRQNDVVINRYTEGGDVFVDDAYVSMDGKEYLSSANDFKSARYIVPGGEAWASEMSDIYPGIRVSLKGEGKTTIIVRHHLTKGEIFANLKLRDDVLLAQTDTFDEMAYQLATHFNAIHYSGYGTSDASGGYDNVTGMAFFDAITGPYGAFGKLKVDGLVMSDQRRIASASGGGLGESLGSMDGTNALSLAKLKQATLFMGGMADFNAVYADFVAEIGAFGKSAAAALKTQDYVAEQISAQRISVMGVNTEEEMLSVVDMNQNFNYASQYISTMFQVIDHIISGIGRVGL
ncbi:MAG: flagellar hook-associated protein FlgK [Synergistaceae bacterium]|jgi:flagellar hook-associated protein 1 FlgK|nr:flagellar hook-associated protein FlgK [Synergistaceae bacterium]